MTNEEKYKTPEERNEAFEAFCAQYKSRKVCYACPCWQVGDRWHINCRFNWLALEAEEEKPLPCPFCGSKVSAVDSGISVAAHVRCDNCHSSSGDYDTKEEAIAAWNKRAK